jgi:hypothetical protein
LRQTEIAPALAANDDAVPATATTPSADGKLLRMRARAFEGLSPEQRELKWDVLKKIVATPKAPVAAAVAKTPAPQRRQQNSQPIAMLRCEGSTTLEAIMATMRWQKHTTRAQLSAGGALAKKHGLEILSEKTGDRRIYFLKA